MSGSVFVPSNRSAMCRYTAKNTNYSTGEVFTFEKYMGDMMLVGFDSSSLPSAMLNKRIEEVRCYVFGNGDSKVTLYVPKESWNESTVTYSTEPSVGFFNTQYNSSLYPASSASYNYASNGGFNIHSILSDGVGIVGNYYTGDIYTSRHPSLAPYLEIYYGDDSPVSGVYYDFTSPRSGYIPKNKSRTFWWAIEQDGYCVADVTVVSSKFRWKESGGSATEVNCGTNTSYTLAGSSITADSILWQFEVVDSLGTTVTSDWYTLSTVEATSTATVQSPVNTMVDGSVDNVFRWTHSISTGTAPTGADLQYSTNGSTWSTLATVSGSATSTTIAAGTLPSGNMYWRVRTYNTDNAAGSWSSKASLFVVNAPATPVVNAEQTPRPLISWQATGQEGYQIRISGVWESSSIYGTDNSKKCPVIIPDGEYTVEVRVVSNYGLWSEWGSAPLTVANSAGAAITLTAAVSDSIYLSWTTSGTYERFLVKRDGEPIAVTADPGYTDRTAVGEHQYTVYGIISGSDNYGVSNTVTATLEVDANSIADIDSGDVLELPFSITQIREEQIRFDRRVETFHVSGAEYPFSEISPWRDKSITFEAAFDKLENAKRLEAMVGHLVCVKAKNEESVVGVLPSLRKTSSAFWISYTATVEQIDRTEVVEL